MDYKEMINHLPILVYGLEYDSKLGPQTGKITYYNSTLSNFIGYTESEIIAMGFDFYRAVIHPDDLYKTSKTIIPMSMNIPNTIEQKAGIAISMKS